MGTFRHIILVVCLILANTLVFAQTPWTVKLNGKVLEDDKPLTRAILILEIEGEEVQKVITAPNGKFTLILESDNDYELFFTKKGYVTKYISYSTKNVPEERISGLYSEFIFQLELFKEMEGLNTSVLSEFPVFKVKYYPGVKNLEYDKKHENKVRSRLALLLKEYEEAKQREADLAASKVTDAEKALVKEKYDAQLELAASLFTEKKYREAQEAYRQAQVILPKADFPKERIAAINKLIKEDDDSKKLPKELQEQYDVLIRLADAAFQKEKYASAKTNYTRASKIAPDKSYPKDQIALASEELLAQKEDPFESAVDVKYNLVIARADNEFMGEDYVRSRLSYQSALKIKADMSYPKNKIAEIDSIVAASRVKTVAVVNDKKPKKKKGKKSTKPSSKPEEEENGGLDLLALAQEYEEGITEEIEVDGGKKTTRIIVVKDGVANEYKMEVFSWATYYKKNNKTIPRSTFVSETKK